VIGYRLACGGCGSPDAYSTLVKGISKIFPSLVTFTGAGFTIYRTVVPIRIIWILVMNHLQDGGRAGTGVSEAPFPNRLVVGAGRFNRNQLAVDWLTYGGRGICGEWTV
jgi:hypothetical protein